MASLPPATLACFFIFYLSSIFLQVITSSVIFPSCVCNDTYLAAIVSQSWAFANSISNPVTNFINGELTGKDSIREMNNFSYNKSRGQWHLCLYYCKTFKTWISSTHFLKPTHTCMLKPVIAYFWKILKSNSTLQNWVTGYHNLC